MADDGRRFRRVALQFTGRLGSPGDLVESKAHRGDDLIRLPIPPSDDTARRLQELGHLVDGRVDLLAQFLTGLPVGFAHFLQPAFPLLAVELRHIIVIGLGAIFPAHRVRYRLVGGITRLIPAPPGL